MGIARAGGGTRGGFWGYRRGLLKVRGRNGLRGGRWGVSVTEVVACWRRVFFGFGGRHVGEEMKEGGE